MAVKVHETGYGKWKVPVIIIAVIVVLGLAGTGILLSDSLGVSIEEGSKRIEVAEGDGTSSVAKLLKDNGIIKYPLLFKVQSKLGGYDGNFQPGAGTVDLGCVDAGGAVEEIPAGVEGHDDLLQRRVARPLPDAV